MRICLTVLLLVLMASGMVYAAETPVMPVGLILEECYKNDDFAVVVPDRLEIICKSSPTDPWNFSFAAFETTWREPIELEVKGSGNYTGQDIFSIAALTLDYGGKDGWIERSHFGLGFIQGSRSPHPPSWGVGSSGKLVMRGNLLNAGSNPQTITIDPVKYAPADWDGRLWIGLLLHNTGVSKSLSVRILNATSPSGQLGPEKDEAQMLNLVRDHQKAYLQWRLKRAPKNNTKSEMASVAPEMLPYAGAFVQSLESSKSIELLRKALEDIKDKPLPAARFVQVTAGQYDGGKTKREQFADKLNGFLKSWQDGGRFGSEIGCVIRTASNLEKIGLTDVESGSIVTRKSAPVSLSAARREYEGFQIILSSLPDCKKKVQLSVTDLKGEKTAIPSTNVTINPVGYIRVFPGQSSEQLCPDPLMLGDVPELKPGENQPVWITVKVPEDAPAGLYRGDVIISADGVKSLKIPVALKVRNFEIPKKISLRSSFWMFRDQLNRFYHLDEVNFDDYMKWIDVALEHRLCPIDVYEGHCNQLLESAIEQKDPQTGKVVKSTPNPNPDFTLWDRYIDRMIAGGATTIHLGQSHHHGGWFSDENNKISSPVQVERVIQSLKMLREHYKERGIFDLHYMQLRDETSAPESLNVYREIQKELPDVKLLLTAPSGDARPLLAIPCPLTPGFDTGWRDEVKSKGGEYWWYVCCAPSDPAWPNFFLHQTGVQNRALFWQTWKNDVDGLLYWGMNFWSWYEYKYPENAKGPGERVPAKAAFDYCPVPGTPGDGFSMYPGPTPSQPLSSVRLEIMRDGEEDYEYLVLLDRLISEAESKGKIGPVLSEARVARQAARKLVPGMLDYEKTPSRYQEVREKVAEAIEGLK